MAAVYVLRLGFGDDVKGQTSVHYHRWENRPARFDVMDEKNGEYVYARIQGLIAPFK